MITTSKTRILFLQKNTVFFRFQSFRGSSKKKTTPGNPKKILVSLNYAFFLSCILRSELTVCSFSGLRTDLSRCLSNDNAVFECSERLSKFFVGLYFQLQNMPPLPGPTQRPKSTWPNYGSTPVGLERTTKWKDTPPHNRPLKSPNTQQIGPVLKEFHSVGDIFHIPSLPEKNIKKKTT